MTVDYDARRRAPVDADESLEDLTRRHHDPTAVSDIDDSDSAESYELPGADLSNEELLVRVVPSRPTSSPAAVAFWSTTAAGWRPAVKARRSAPSAPECAKPRAAATAARGSAIAG